MGIDAERRGGLLAEHEIRETLVPRRDGQHGAAECPNLTGHAAAR